MVTTPGILDLKLQLAPMARISPTRYVGLKQCALREVWSSSHQPSLLPSAPSARLGSVIHQLLQEAGSSYFQPVSRNEIEVRWEELIANVEQEMSNSWLERHLVPLRTTIQEYEVRHIRATNHAAEIAYKFVPQINYLATAHPRTGTELPVASHDGLVAGRIDRVVMSAEGPVIIDYKSGAVLEGISGSDMGTVKAAYELQLHLYAALYEATTGIWPVRLELVSLSGSVVIVPFERASCSAVLRNAVAALHETNNIISSGTSNEAELQLANPSPEHCRYCPFRPVCRSYQESRDSNNELPGWPSDVNGKVTIINVLGNSKLAIGMLTSSHQDQLTYIRGISNEVTRHPALEHLQPGDTASLYNLKYGLSGNAFSETQITTIYKVPDTRKMRSDTNGR